MNIKIIKTNRNFNTLIPQELIRNDELLVEGIEQYCNSNKLNPVYIDSNIAIFSDHLLMSLYEDEI